jgi:hypothetical protein
MPKRTRKKTAHIKGWWHDPSGRDLLNKPEALSLNPSTNKNKMLPGII